MPDPSDPSAVPRFKLVIVTGSGRSGTSTVAGALKRLGLHIPQPENEADSKNPRGYYEPTWATSFDKDLLKRVGVHNNDARPDALERCADLAADPAVQTELQTWLAGQSQASQILVKDPHVLWLSELWTDAINALGGTPGFLTMLRHPAEVVGSRDLAYLSKRPEDFRRLRETANVAGWINIMLANEHASRPYQRAFVRYTDLIGDWRRSLAAASEDLGLSLNADLGDRRPHEVDDFIDVDLRRSRVTWQELDVSPELKELAEGVWGALDTLVEKPHDLQAQSELDNLRTAYDRAHAHAVGFAHYQTEASIADARDELRKRLRRKHRKDLAQARRRLKRRSEPEAGSHPAGQEGPSLAQAASRRVRRLLGAREATSGRDAPRRDS